MKFSTNTLKSLSLCLSLLPLATSPVSAVSYNNDNLDAILCFRKLGAPNPFDLEVNIGSITNYTKQAVGTTVMFGGWYSHGGEDSWTVKTGGYFMMLAALVALVQVFLLLVQETSTSNGTQWWSRLYGWQNNLPWVKAGYGVRIPISEPGIRKAQ